MVDLTVSGDDPLCCGA